VLGQICELAWPNWLRPHSQFGQASIAKFAVLAWPNWPTESDLLSLLYRSLLSGVLIFQMKYLARARFGARCMFARGRRSSRTHAPAIPLKNTPAEKTKATTYDVALQRALMKHQEWLNRQAKKRGTHGTSHRRED